MKFATLFLVSVLIFVFTSPSLSTSILTVYDNIVLDNPVLDVEGNHLQKDVGYTISPPLWGPLGGPVKLDPPLNNETCEADVIQDPIDFEPGTPFTFTPVNPSEGYVKVGYPITIQTPTENPCGKSTVWQVSRREGVDAHIITTGGSINTGPSCLRIVKPLYPMVPNSYVMEHCPYMCAAGAKICRTVGIYGSWSTSGKYIRHLSTDGIPFQFVLIKKSESAAKKI